jgi:anhydro-N-acetylmuramic acid kinase
MNLKNMSDEKIISTPERDQWVIGLMSGTSMDGVDAALVKTDGQVIYEVGKALTMEYPIELHQRLLKAVNMAQMAKGISEDTFFKDVERDLTDIHRDAVFKLMKNAGLPAKDVRLIGFHGQTLYHNPAMGITWQIGDGNRLAQSTNIPVVNDFRTNDVAAGGEGAPLVPIYHWAIMGIHGGDDNVVAVLNIGGVTNVTWMDLKQSEPKLLGFDTGTGNGPIDDVVREKADQNCDWHGALAAEGKVFHPLLEGFTADPYFARKPPKSIDRNEFSQYMTFSALSVEDAAATATQFAVEGVTMALEHFPAPVSHWYVCGGGTHNKTLMACLNDTLEAPVDDVKVLGLRGDFIEAEAFAFLAARSEKGLPITFPTTTNVKAATTGGTLWQP